CLLVSLCGLADQGAAQHPGQCHRPGKRPQNALRDRFESPEHVGNVLPVRALPAAESGAQA
nr:hypothetical protein [Tanacetum cinerariifolium]